VSFEPSSPNLTTRRRLLFLVTEDWFFVSHFKDRALAAQAAGYEVIVLSNDNGWADSIREAGFTFVPVPFVRRGLNPVKELGVLHAVLGQYRELRPDVLHHIALKPILYGSIAARFAGLKGILNAPVGMGFVFASRSLLSGLLRPIVELGLRFLLNPPGSRVVFENPDDLGQLVGRGAVRGSDAVLIRGAGVDTEVFSPAAEPDGPPVVVLVSRMLWEKGVGDFVEAARRVKSDGVSARFLVVGSPDNQNPSAISEAQLEDWHSEGAVEWLGHRNDVASILKGAHIFCLPTYYAEGLPKSVLEAMAVGLPVVTTDAPGCREAVHDGENGLLVQPRDPSALAAALRQLIADRPFRRRMGAESRRRAVTEFATGIVTAQTMAVYDRLAEDGRERAG
jgi:glycosyltransferase involved in cell wall biosynthesis